MPVFFIEQLGKTGCEIAIIYFDIRDQETGATAKKVRVIYSGILENILTDPSKWGEEKLIEIEWAISSFPGHRKYQRIQVIG